MLAREWAFCCEAGPNDVAGDSTDMMETHSCMTPESEEEGAALSWVCTVEWSG